MINRTKLEHILEYARQQRRFGQLCKILPGDMVEIVEIAMRKAGNYPVTPDGWISCSERMPDSKTAVLVAREFDRKGDWRMKWATYIPGHPDANDGWLIPGASWKPSHWMPLPEPPQEVNRG
ncbi:TPA: DUF551 domain-containing protein [Escherichia coli]|uniref:DUF551 domain-containing protein n=1 Tax=Escherichia phage HK022 TaxID=2681618 RepID=A0A2I6PID9_BPHK0|nr:DUF551 domain-containing protein [Escherichia coli]AUM59811.1 hypothetical protein HK022_35 [Escherichia phage HK022]EHN2277034.1 DUF551 domain-containing protein [Shigella sonnei]WGB62578.1 DUF551 domain-containing protein [Escherichia coli]WJS45443.1 DUF551 domain-containing protein [Escherichia coli]HCM0138527.1 DUF551 domain-containing protein [Escherichia coli]